MNRYAIPLGSGTLPRRMALQGRSVPKTIRPMICQT